MAGLRSVILLVILGATLVAGASPGRIRCDLAVITANLTNPETLKDYQRMQIHAVWDSKFLPKFNRTALRLVKMMTDIAEGERNYQRSVAYLHSSLASIVLQPTNLERQPCIFVEMINSAIAYEIFNNATPAVETLRKFANGVHDIRVCLRAGEGALKQVQCEGLQYVPTLVAKCNWIRYDIDTAWYLFGDGMPFKVRSLVKSLYRSRDLVDKLMAMMMTLSITPLAQEIYFGHNQAHLLESVSFISESFHKFCCAQRRQRIIELCKYHESDTLNEISLITSTYSNSVISN